MNVKLRIPGWAPTHQLEPSCSGAVLEKGYLTLPGEWLEKNPSFRLTIPLSPRWVAPNPLTGQDTVALARGPVIYCVEDYDNTWVQDHFKVRRTSQPSNFSTLFNTNGRVGNLC